MKRSSRILWGILLIGAGVLVGLKVLGLWEVDLFFDGWWTLFIILPCGVGLITEREKWGNLIGLVIGVALLLGCRDILNFELIWKLLIPVIIVLVGLKLVLGGIFGNKGRELLDRVKESAGDLKSGCATFSGCNMDFAGEVFEGAELSAVFGGVKCDLRNAIIEKDCAIEVTAVFGGIDILVPEHINVKTQTNAIFGGTSDKTIHNKENAVTLYVSGTCMFGGVEIK